MGGGGKKDCVTWGEVQEHNKPGDQWLVIDGQVYNITQWANRHPGGHRVISYYAGQDATEAFKAFHNDLVTVKKYLRTLHVGAVDDYRKSGLDEDFRELYRTVKKKGYFKPSYTFFLMMMAQLCVLEVLSYMVMAHFGTGWLPYLISLLCSVTLQAQAGYIQHDFGHFSMFRTKLDHVAQKYVMGIVKGISPSWWNYLHFQHHAKPNVIKKDPDVAMDKLFVIGDVMPVEVAKSRKDSMPFNWQHRYFCFMGPPMLFPVYYHTVAIRHIFTRKLPIDFVLVLVFFVKFFYLYTPMLGVVGSTIFYVLIKCLESHWFIWVSQSNHTTMTIDNDQALHWVKLQINATCNVQKSAFNDWFTGHLNFQIEHHLFPSMPRHNLYKAAPLVKALCKKHDIKYEVKPLITAFTDILRCLKKSGALWEETYNMYHT